MKVSDYGVKIANWVADHPNADNQAVMDAKRGFAKEVRCCVWWIKLGTNGY